MGILDTIIDIEQAKQRQEDELDRLLKESRCPVCGSNLIDNTVIRDGSRRLGGSLDCLKCQRAIIIF